MPFNVADIYTTSGDASLFNSWTTPVTKFDPSSFYNWEQDNEPLHDLEERTYMNWEHAGFHTSTVPGMVFTVSGPGGDGATGDPGPPAAVLAANPNIFATVSAAVEALPSDIRFPIIIEVANYGNLGELNLKNINIGYGGSLEIINRNCVRSYASSGGPGAADVAAGTEAIDIGRSTCTIHKLGTHTGATTGAGAKYEQYNLISEVSSVDSSAVWSTTSAVHISATVVSGSKDIRLTNSINSFYQPFASGQGNYRLSVGVGGSPSGGASPNIFKLWPFESTAAALADPHNINFYDVSAKDAMAPNHPELILAESKTHMLAQGMMYGNYVHNIEVTNCNGPIYIRNFFINSSDHTLEGCRVFNSTDVWLENCASINNKVGFSFVNSRVYINRAIVAYRNYGTTPASKRKTGTWLSAMGNPEAQFLDDGGGLRAVNSEIILNTASSMYARQGSDQTTLGSFEHEVFPSEFIINFSRNSVGVSLDNSVFRGGWPGNSTSYLSGLSFNVELNDEYGVHLKHSTFDLDGKLKVYSNHRGMLLESSKATINECIFKGNQREGLHCINSNILYNKNLQSISKTNKTDQDAHIPDFAGTTWARGGKTEDITGIEEYQFDFSGNGRHLILDQGSTFLPMQASGMPSRYGQMRFLDHHGLSVCSAPEYAAMARILSPIEVKNNSRATFVHPIIKSFSNPYNVRNNVASGIPIYGECLSVTNNSKALLQGSVNGASVIYASDGDLTNTQAYEARKRSAGVYASNNSEVEFNGPTAIFNFGVDVLAKNSSIMNFNPHKLYNSESLDTSGWDLITSGNHTSVELHSTQSCLVAQNKSIINVKDLGDFNSCWGGDNRADPDYDTGPEGYGTSGCTSGGSMQFYPNPMGAVYYNQHHEGVATQPAAIIRNGAYDGYTHQVDHKFVQFSPEAAGNASNYYLDVKPFAADVQAVSATAGGFCLRALGGSQVNVLNVNFPAGWWNASGLIYDVSGAEKGSKATLCNQQFIWNIADNSTLHAAFCSVSSMDPRTVAYNGPSSVYAPHAQDGVYQAPSGTMDTSTLSVLDFFGQSPGGKADNWPIPQFSSLVVSAGMSDGGTVGGKGVGYVSHTHQQGFQVSTPLKFAQYGTAPTVLENRGPFRIHVSVDPITNSFSSIDHTRTPPVYSDDGFAPQIYAQGYNLSSDVSAGPPSVSAVYGGAILDPRNISTIGGSLALSGFVYNNQVVDPTTYNRILLDESAAHTFANAKNGATGTSNRSKICSIYISRIGYRGEGASAEDTTSYGRGYTTSNFFDLERNE